MSVSRLCGYWLLGLLGLACLLASCKAHQERSQSPLLDDPTLKVAQRPVVEFEVVCKTRCRNGLLQVNTITAAFDAVERGLVRAEGGMYGGLAASLNLFASDQCLGNAERRCGDLTQVAALRVASLHAGAWQSGYPLACDAQEQVFSPFAILPDGAASGMEDGSQGDRQALPNRARPETQTSFALADLRAEGQTCGLWLQAALCHGDCMQAHPKDAQWYPALASPAPRTAQVKVCADTFVKQMSVGPRLSESVLELYCQQYFWNSALGLDSLQHARQCASLRGRAECRPVLQAMGASVARSL